MFKQWFYVVSVFIITAASCFAQATGPGKTYYDTLPASTWAWTAESWTRDDKPYLKIRQNIDKAVAGGQKPDALLTKYQALAQKKPYDPQAQFRWAYAAWQARKAVDSYDQQYRRLWRTQRAFARVPSPHVYEYARLRFLVEAWFRRVPQFKGVGERLAHRNSNDYEVKYYLASILDTSPLAEERERALGYAKDVIRLQPKRPSSYSLLGGVYFSSWLKTKNRSDAEKAIAAYQQYLQLASPNAEWRPQAKRLIQILQRGESSRQKSS